MALTKQKKTEVIDETAKLISTSKMVVVAKYQGLKVSDMQQLRKQVKDNDTTVKVIKNRLFLQATKKVPALSKVKADFIDGMLLYGFNENDELGAAQVLNKFAKEHPELQFVGAINSNGEIIDADNIKTMAGLPSKAELIAQVTGLLGSPIRGLTSSLNSGINKVVLGLQAKT